MSWLSKVTGVHVKVPGLAQVGGYVDKHLPAIGGAALGSAGGMLLGHLAQGDNIGQAIGGTAGDVGRAAAGGAAMVGLPAVLGAVPGVGGALSGAAGALGKPGVQGLGSFLGGLGGQAASFLGGNGGKNALGVAEGVNAAMLQKRQNELAGQALGTAQQSYNERAGLRSAGIDNMLNPGAGIAPRIAALTANSSNPYTKQMPTQPVPAPAGGG